MANSCVAGVSTKQRLLASRRVSKHDGPSKHEIIFREENTSLHTHESSLWVFPDNLACQTSNQHAIAIFHAERRISLPRKAVLPSPIPRGFISAGETATDTAMRLAFTY